MIQIKAVSEDNEESPYVTTTIRVEQTKITRPEVIEQVSERLTQSKCCFY